MSDEDKLAACMTASIAQKELDAETEALRDNVEVSKAFAPPPWWDRDITQPATLILKFILTFWVVGTLCSLLKLW